jgi:FtsZ-binding cell division protein ZapB
VGLEIKKLADVKAHVQALIVLKQKELEELDQKCIKLRSELDSFQRAALALQKVEERVATEQQQPQETVDRPAQTERLQGILHWAMKDGTVYWQSLTPLTWLERKLRTELRGASDEKIEAATRIYQFLMTVVGECDDEVADKMLRGWEGGARPPSPPPPPVTQP